MKTSCPIYCRAVKDALLDRNQTQRWLIEEVRKETGQYFDSGYLQGILSGRKKEEKKRKKILEILQIPKTKVRDLYE